MTWVCSFGVPNCPVCVRPGARYGRIARKGRQYLCVTYAEKDIVKALKAGACWDPTAKEWYVASYGDATKFVEWDPRRTPAERLAAKNKRLGIVTETAPVVVARPGMKGVPAPEGAIKFNATYAQGQSLKALGARFDWNDKRWYALAGADIAMMLTVPGVTLVAPAAPPEPMVEGISLEDVGLSLPSDNASWDELQAALAPAKTEPQVITLHSIIAATPRYA